MIFTPSKDLIEAGRSIYLYGAVGALSRIFSIKYEKSPILDFPLPSDSGFSVAGVLGLVVLFKLVSFILRSAVESVDQRIIWHKRGRTELEKALTIQQIEQDLPNDANKQELAIAIATALSRNYLLRSVFAFGAGILEVIFPAFFGFIVMVVLFQPAVSFAMVCINRLWSLVY